VEIRFLVWDDANEEHLAYHGIAPHDVEDVLNVNEWVIDRHPRYPDQIRMIGFTRGGRWLTVAMDPTPWPDVWRPVTGWDSTSEERDYWREQNPDEV
jgi:hypothetical protein